MSIFAVADDIRFIIGSAFLLSSLIPLSLIRRLKWLIIEAGSEVVYLVYSIDDLRKKITPVAQKYHLRAVYLFGSYARNEATEDSDVDILIDRDGSKIRGMLGTGGMLGMGGLYNDLRESIGKEIDLVTTQTLEQESTRFRAPVFIDTLRSEMVKIYE